MPTRPNILFIMTDQHSPRIAGFAGDAIVDTRHLDRLADRSLQFDAAVCASPVCTASRMCILTGKEAHRCSAWNNHWVIFPEHLTWPAHLAAHGYRTCFVGKMHMGGRDQMVGFQHRPYGDLRHGVGHQAEPLELFPGYGYLESAAPTEIPESLISDVVTTRETQSFILEHQAGEPDTPWFVWASYTRPHYPLTAPGRYLKKYHGRVAPPTLPDDYKEKLDRYARCVLEREGAGASPEQITRALEGYYAATDFVDDCIGELLTVLESAGALDNTIIIYTSDHGEMAGAHGLWGKTIYYEQSMCVPLLITGPGIAAGHHHITEPVSLMDLFPTTCGLLNLPAPDGIDGIDISATLADPQNHPNPRPFAPTAYYTYGVRVKHLDPVNDHTPNRAMRAIRTRDWKYVEIEGGDPLLFDLVADPDENANLASLPEHAQRCRQMREDLFRDFSWEHVHRQLEADRVRLTEFRSGQKPTTPNQYMLKDGRIFDAEGDLYAARWLYVPREAVGGLIPQQFG